MDATFPILLVLTCLAYCQGVGGAGGDGKKEETGTVYQETRLIARLLDGYVKEARPVLQPWEAVNVTVKVNVVRIEDIDETTDTFSSTILLVQVWKDPRLKWNAYEYGNLMNIRLPIARIWSPDIVLYNVATKAEARTWYEETAVVMFDGTVAWIPLMTLHSTCPMDMTRFPFDTQTCELVFGSWMHSAKEMDVRFVWKNLTEISVELTEEDASLPVHEHPEWLLVDNKAMAKIKQIKYACCLDPFVTMTLTVRLQRRAMFFRYLTVGPAAVLGLLVPTLFLLPPMSGHKTTFGLSILLCLTVLILALQEAIPFNHSSVPHIGTFYLGTVLLTSFSVILSVITFNLSVRGTRRRPLPSWLHAIFLGRYGLRRILCIDKYAPLDNLYASSMRHLEQHSDADMEVVSDSMAASGSKLESTLVEISRYLKYMVGRLAASETYENVNQDWIEFARVIDRLCFVIFFIFYICTAISLLT